ncbi:hypothetical protein P879_07051, partial [Paragonimus westermani]
INLNVVDADHVFYLEPVENSEALLFIDHRILPTKAATELVPERLSSASEQHSVASQLNTAGLLLQPGKQFCFRVFYRPNQSGLKSLGQIRLLVVNNPYEDTLVELVGESLADEVCLYDLPQLEPERARCIKEALIRCSSASKGAADSNKQDGAESESTWDEVQTIAALRHNHLDFGDCPPSEPVSYTFTFTHCGKLDNMEPTSFRYAWPTDHPNLQFQPSEGHLHPNQSRRITVTFCASNGPVTLQASPIKCVLRRIRLPIPEGCTKPVDWDDTKQMIRWVDAPLDPSKQIPVGPDGMVRSTSGSRTNSRLTPTSREGHHESPTDNSDVSNSDCGCAAEVIRKKQKLIEVEPEPQFEEIVDRPEPKPLELLVSVVSDYARFSCDVDCIIFKETLMLQRRIYRFELSNTGLVTLNYRWVIEMMYAKDTGPTNSGTNSDATDLTVSATTQVSDDGLPPFSVRPNQGSLLPGKLVHIEVTFSPLSVGKFEARLRGLFDNTPDPGTLSAKGRSSGKATQLITLEGVAKQPFIHFDLHESDYLTAGRRNPELPGPAGTPIGVPLDNLTKVVEVQTVGIGNKTSKRFTVANLTTMDLHFVIDNEDLRSPKDHKTVTCVTNRGHIASGKQTELCFEARAHAVGIFESFWRLKFEQLQFSVPLLVVAHVREPDIVFDRSSVNFRAVLVGHTVSQTVYLYNREADSELGSEPLEFAFLDSSRYGPGRQDVVLVEPISGQVHPNKPFPIQVSFTAKAERLTNVNLVCQVKLRKSALTLNVKAEGYTMSVTVWAENGDNQTNLYEISPLWNPCLGVDVRQLAMQVGQRVKAASLKYQPLLDVLDFGVVDPGECITRSLTLINCGKFKCDFAWHITALKPSKLISTNPEDGLTSTPQQTPDQFVSGGIDRGIHSTVSISPQEGCLHPGDKVICTATFAPPKQMRQFGPHRVILDGLVVACLAFREGPAFGLELHGRTSGRVVCFSSSVIDFGAQFVSRPGLLPACRQLQLSNTDPTRSISVECLTPNSAIFQHTMVPTILQAKSAQSKAEQTNDSTSLWITFTPQACQKYEEKLVFEVNGSALYSVKLYGQGTSLHIEAEPGPLTIITVNKSGSDKINKKTKQLIPTDNVIDLGLLQSGQRSRRFVTLVNRSIAPIEIHRVTVSPSYQPAQKSQFIGSRENTKVSLAPSMNPPSAPSVEVRLCNPIAEDHQLSLAPVSNALLPTILEANGGKITVEVSFQSTKRLERFTEEVLCELAAVDRDRPNIQPPEEGQENKRFYLPVFIVQGAYKMHDIRFDMDSVNFGPVVCGGQLTKRLVLVNYGDLGAKFTWVEKTFGSGLTIEPMDGFIAPNTEVPFNVTLAPTKLAQEVRMENVTCQLQDYENKYITITGMCVPPILIKDIISFCAAVRQQDVRGLQIANRTNARWLLRPTIEGAEWTGAQMFEVEAQDTGTYEVIYKPISMTTEGRKHKGSVFIPLPDGTGLLYQLSGTAEAPKPLGKVTREVECKKPHIEPILVPNWLNRAQRFRVTTELVRSEKSDLSTYLKGLDYIDVPADGSREYKLHFFSYREGNTMVRVTFTNELTEDYQYYEINFRTVRPKSLATIKIRTPVRKSAKHSFRMENPLNVPITFQLNSTVPELKCPSQLQVAPNCSGYVTLEFLPLCVGPHLGRLDASCTELGLFSHTLELEATPAANEPGLQFQAAVGHRQVRSAKFTNFARVKTEFSAKIDNLEFQCEKTINAAPGVELTLDVVFEPTAIGTSYGTLTVSSTQAGEYVFPLQGVATEPQPQGPIIIRSGETAYINFRNVFTSSMLYSFQVDNLSFHLTKQSEVIRSRKEYRIAVGLDSSVATTSPVTGKLIVTCLRAEVSARAGRARGTAATTTTESTAATAQSTSKVRKPEAGKGMQWIFYLRGVPSS